MSFLKLRKRSELLVFTLTKRKERPNKYRFFPTFLFFFFLKFSNEDDMNIEHSGVCICMLGVLLSNTKKIQFTQRLPLGSELHMGKERCCLRGLGHLHGPTFHGICGHFLIYKPSLTNDRLIFEHDESLRADLLPINFPASYENGKLEHFLHRWMKNSEHKNLWLTMFPEKRDFRETTSTTEVAIHTNPFTDLYAEIGTGRDRTGGWYTTIMKLPFLFFIRIGFMLASSGGSRSLLRQLQKDKLRWNWESSVEFNILISCWLLPHYFGVKAAVWYLFLTLHCSHQYGREKNQAWICPPTGTEALPLAAFRKNGSYTPGTTIRVRMRLNIWNSTDIFVMQQ